MGRESFEIVTEKLGKEHLRRGAPIFKRVIHTTEDFEFTDILKINVNRT